MTSCSTSNPIIAIKDVDGFKIWGSQTLQRKPLDRVGVRRLLFYIEKQLRNIMRQHLASRLNSGWLDFDVYNFMEDIKNRCGVASYQFVTDNDCIMLGVCVRENSPCIWVNLTVG